MEVENAIIRFFNGNGSRRLDYSILLRIKDSRLIKTWSLQHIKN